MKAFKIFLSLFLFIGIASCSSDDDGNSNGPVANDPIIGQWKMQSFILDGEPQEITECEARSILEFFANGNVTSTDFYEDFDTGECISEISTQKWQNMGNNVYRIKEGNQFTDMTVDFSADNNAFTISEENEYVSVSMTYTRV